MKVGVLTSSRADYGIYLPLLNRLKKEKSIELEIIAFGTHLKENFGLTISLIKKDEYKIIHEIDTLLEGDSPLDISLSYAKTIELFARFWNLNKYDWVFCLGDRFEMAAAVNASIPFQVNLAHIHAGETTLGAIDNVYRHQISLASKLHFASLRENELKIHELLGENNSTEKIGSLSLLNLQSIDLLTIEEFYTKWDIDLNLPTILVSVHPETVAITRNVEYAIEVRKALKDLSNDFQIVITLPNADTNGSIYRSLFLELNAENQAIKLIENFGTQSYFTCMKYSRILLGNTSSGIIEAATFNKFVINLGNRQGGRIAPKNVIHSPFEHQNILKLVEQYIHSDYTDENPYLQKDSIDKILKRLQIN